MEEGQSGNEMLVSLGDYEGGLTTDHHLIKQNTKCPPVDCLGVPLALKEFGRDVFGSATEGCDRKLSIGITIEEDDTNILLVFSVSDMFSLHSPTN